MSKVSVARFPLATQKRQLPRPDLVHQVFAGCVFLRRQVTNGAFQKMVGIFHPTEIELADFRQLALSIGLIRGQSLKQVQLFKHAGSGGDERIEETTITGEIVTADTGLHIRHVAHQLTAVANYLLGVIDPAEGRAQVENFHRKQDGEQRQQSHRYGHSTAQKPFETAFIHD